MCLIFFKSMLLILTEEGPFLSTATINDNDYKLVALNSTSND